MALGIEPSHNQGPQSPAKYESKYSYDCLLRMSNTKNCTLYIGRLVETRMEFCWDFACALGDTGRSVHTSPQV